MLDKLTGKSIHYWIHFVAICGITVGLPWSKIPLSLGTILLGLNIILKWDWRTYWHNWKTNTWLLWFFLYLALDWISLIWSDNIPAGMEDMRTKIPLYTLPLTLTAIPLKDAKHVKWIGALFIGAMLFFTVLNFAFYQHWIGSVVYNDIRGMSLFISHIRFSIMVVFALVLVAGWFVRRLPGYWLTLPLALWFLFYTYYSQVVSGYLVLTGFIAAILYFKLLSIPALWLRRLFLFSILGLLLVFVIFIIKEIQPIPHRFEINEEMINSKTANGNPYTFEIPENMIWENGYPVQAFICESELAREWKKVSDLDYYAKDEHGNYRAWIIFRYMSSKGLKKDSADFQLLTPLDIQNMEKGVASVELLRGGIFSQLYRVRRQIMENIDPNGQTLLERIEFLKAGKHIIVEHPFLGVGMGDKEDAFQETYVQINSKLALENRHETHNQFITSWITSGIFGFASFLLWWFFFLREGWRLRALEWTAFAIICILSFLTEDTLETQTGNTFVAFFFGLFIANGSLIYRKKDKATI